MSEETRSSLARLEAALAGIDHPLTAAPSDGLTDTEIDRTLAGLDIELPDQARELWRWRNGWADPPFLPFNLGFFTLAQAVDHFREHRTQAPRYGVDAIHEGLFPAFGEGMEYVSFGISGSVTDDVPVLKWDIDDPLTTIEERDANSIESIPAMIDQAAELFESGIYTYDGYHEIVPVDPEKPWGEHWAF